MPLSLRRLTKLQWVTTLLLITTVVIVFSTNRLKRLTMSVNAVQTPAQNIIAQPTPVRRRPLSILALQPEADKQRRRIGQRFLESGREISTWVGTVTLGSDRQTVRIVRNQDDDDERLTITLGSGPASLTWSGKDGAKSNGNAATNTLRTLVERLALDSPDQFILAQLRGASYQTIARDVRPAEVGGANNYTGPRWDLVRVAEPSRLTQNRPQSLWRLYYINSATGLIEKIVSQESGQTITAEVSGWVNQSGETVPTRTVWKVNNQTIMELALTNITHNPKQ